MKKKFCLVFSLIVSLPFYSNASQQSTNTNAGEKKIIETASERYTIIGIIHKMTGRRLALPEYVQTPEAKAAAQIAFPTHGERSFDRSNSFDEYNNN